MPSIRTLRTFVFAVTLLSGSLAQASVKKNCGRGFIFFGYDFGNKASLPRKVDEFTPSLREAALLPIRGMLKGTIENPTRDEWLIPKDQKQLEATLVKMARIIGAEPSLEWPSGAYSPDPRPATQDLVDFAIHKSKFKLQDFFAQKKGLDGVPIPILSFSVGIGRNGPAEIFVTSQENGYRIQLRRYGSFAERGSWLTWQLEDKVFHHPAAPRAITLAIDLPPNDETGLEDLLKPFQGLLASPGSNSSDLSKLNGLFRDALKDGAIRDFLASLAGKALAPNQKRLLQSLRNRLAKDPTLRARSISDLNDLVRSAPGFTKAKNGLLRAIAAEQVHAMAGRWPVATRGLAQYEISTPDHVQIELNAMIGGIWHLDADGNVTVPWTWLVTPQQGDPSRPPQPTLRIVPQVRFGSEAPSQAMIHSVAAVFSDIAH